MSISVHALHKRTLVDFVIFAFKAAFTSLRRNRRFVLFVIGFRYVRERKDGRACTTIRWVV